MVDQASIAQTRVFDANGDPVAGAKAYFYASGTTTLIDVYLDEAGAILSANPVIADANGALPQTFVSVEAKCVVKTSADATLYTVDPVPTTSSTSYGASQVSFSPTTDLPYTDVQAAIEGSDTAWRDAIEAAGVGQTGNGPALTSIDATNIPAGVGYRVTDATTGTFPTGVAATDHGVVAMYRATSDSGYMTLQPNGESTIYSRNLTGGTWGNWQFGLTVEADGTNGQVIRRDTLPEWSDPIAYATAVDTTSGTAFSFTGIPSWAKRVDVIGQRISMDATDNLLIQVGTSADGILTSGYNSDGAAIDSGAHSASSSAGFIIDTDTASANASFVMTLRRLGTGGHRWISAHSGHLSSGSGLCGGGYISLTSALDRVRLTSVGASTFDEGAINISWE